MSALFHFMHIFQEKRKQKNPTLSSWTLAAELGFEPRQTESESVVLTVTQFRCIGIAGVSRSQRQLFYHNTLRLSIPFLKKINFFEMFFWQNILTNFPTCDTICKYLVRPVGQAVKTSPSHGENMGSIPVRVTI